MRQTDEVHLGDRVRLEDRILIVRGVSPMSVEPQLLHLVDRETGEEVDAYVNEIELVPG